MYGTDPGSIPGVGSIFTVKLKLSMLKLQHLGKVSLPRGVAASGLKTLNKTALRIRELSQGELDAGFSETIKKRLRSMVGDALNWVSQESLLIYRKVGRHSDDWPKTRYKKKWVATAFLHVVLSGRCDIKAGNKTLSVKRGDVFLLNPNTQHEVTSSTLCMTYCLDVPAAAFKKGKP